MRWTWLVWLSVAACGGDSFVVEIRVPPQMVADRVELFIGELPCLLEGTDVRCPSIVPPGSLDRVTAQILDRDSDLPLIANVDDGSAWFQLAPGAHVVTMIAVARAGGPSDGVPPGASLLAPLDLAGERVRVVSELVVPGAITGGDGFGAVAWSSPDGARRCAGVRKHADAEALFIVSPGDPDCDGLASECDELAYLAEGPPPDASLSKCAARVTVNDPPFELCMLGGATCNERSGQPEACHPSDTCAPFPLCVECAGLDRPDCLLGVITDHSRPSLTRIHCDISLAPPEGGSHQLCPFPGGPGPRIETSAKLDTQIQRGCGETSAPAISMSPLSLPLAFADRVTVKTDGGTGSRDEITIKVGDITDCDFTLEVQGTVSAVLAEEGGNPLRAALVRFSLAAPSVVASGPRHVVVPIELELRHDLPNGCTAVSACQILHDPVDPVFACGDPLP